MKTRKLISLLKQLDPSGDSEVSIDNQDIHIVESISAPCDGLLQVHIKDETKKGYNIKGVKFCNQGKKIRLVPLGYEEIIFENPNAEIQFEDEISEIRRSEIESIVEDLQIQSSNVDLEIDSFDGNVLKLEKTKSIGISDLFVCPKCEQNHCFIITTKVKIVVKSDSEIDLCSDIQPNEGDLIQCFDCEEYGLVRDFKK